MSNDQAKEKPVDIRILSTEVIPQPISWVVCEAGVAMMVMGMGARLHQGYHDMVVLFGPRDQTGPERYVQSASLVLNNRLNNPIFDANEAALNAVHEYQASGHPDAVILGIGSSLSTDEQIASALQFFPLHCAASVFSQQRWGIAGMVLDKPYFFALDANNKPAIIPPSNVSLAHTAIQ